MNFVLMSQFFRQILKTFFKIFRIIVDANSNTFIVFVFVLIKKVFEKDKNFFLNFAREIINM